MNSGKPEQEQRAWFGRSSVGYAPFTWQGWFAVAAFAVTVAVLGRGIFTLVLNPLVAGLVALAITLAITMWFVRFVDEHVDPHDRK
jgi:hypothetical protein